jgi:hypothetical protein
MCTSYLCDNVGVLDPLSLIVFLGASNINSEISEIKDARGLGPGANSY